ncbi:hypothetical protein EHQ52_15410 [Leptospira koniambonensis]|uniref:Uncharacterized protein n=1 Tax=Leptospira koniambonensis TaxID=2484950 RepID=A0A4R9J2W1_9LEPT|nr:hypothetical protein [Leptospira koniambonensis]TGL31323.1 hypothetical protein EHQ52_15410 [Leptospira koniambonensis]
MAPSRVLLRTATHSLPSLHLLRKVRADANVAKSCPLYASDHKYFVKTKYIGLYMIQNFFLVISFAMATFYCAKPLLIQRHLDSTSYYYACGSVLRNNDSITICEQTFPSDNLTIRKDYENWLKEQSPYIYELEQVCKSDNSNYKRMKDLFAKDDAKIKAMILRSPNEFLKECKNFSEGLRKYPKSYSKEMLWELVH